MIKYPAVICPRCGSSHSHGGGVNVTTKGKFHRRKCQECGKTFYDGIKIERKV